MPEPLKIGFGFTHTLEGCRIAGLHVDRSPRVITHRVPEAAVAVLQAFSMSGRRLAGVGFQPFLSFAIMLAAWFSPKVLSASSGLPNFAQIALSFVGLSCPVGAAVLEHELVDRELSVLTAQEPDRPGYFPDGVPDVALVDVDLSTLGGGLYAKHGRCGR